MNHNETPEWIDRAALSAPVALLMGVDDVSIDDWACKQVFSGAGGQLGVWRLTGTANGAGASRRWSMFLKAWAPADAVPASWNWSHREPAAYRSGVPASMPDGIAAPRLLGEATRPDGAIWLWLEDVAGDADAAWPLERYAKAARLLGKWNGAYLTGLPLPDHDWLSHNWLRHWVEAAAPAIETIVEAREHPVIRQAFPPGSIEAFRQLWEDRHACFASIDALPKTFCHLDAFRRNLFFRQHAGGVEELVAIDWGFCGIGAIGEDLAPLVAASVFFMEIPGRQVRQLEQLALDGYIAGLRDAGWNGNPEQVWTGYANAVVLRYGIGGHRVLLPWLMDERNHRRLELIVNRPVNDLIEQLRMLNEWLADLSGEARHGIRST